MKTAIIHDLLASNSIIDHFGWEDVPVVVALDHVSWEVVGADVSAAVLAERLTAAGYTVRHEDDAYEYTEWGWRIRTVVDEDGDEMLANIDRLTSLMETPIAALLRRIGVLTPDEATLVADAAAWRNALPKGDE